MKCTNKRCPPRLKIYHTKIEIFTCQSPLRYPTYIFIQKSHCKFLINLKISTYNYWCKHELLSPCYGISELETTEIMKNKPGTITNETLMLTDVIVMQAIF